MTPITQYQYQYDENRRLSRKIFPSLQEIVYDYDDGNGNKALLRHVITPEGTIGYTYACGSNPETISMGTQSITYDYDGDLVTSVTLAGDINKVLTYQYDNDGDFDLDGFTYAGITESYAYDNDGLLTGAGNYTVIRDTDNGQPDQVTGNALVLDRAFNAYGETDGETYTVNGTAVGSWSVVTRDEVGRITEKTETVNGATDTYVYTYDDNGRLETVTKNGTLVEEYFYDRLPYGTCDYRMNALRGISGEDLVYDDEDRLLTTGSSSYTYNDDGFLDTKTTGADLTSYSYSSRGELLDVTLPDTTVVSYVHDPLGRRIAKKIDGTVVEKYLWSGLTTLLAVYDGSDTLLMRFDYADGRMPASMTKGGLLYYLTYDQTGSLKSVADATGAVVKIREYDTFGYILSDSNPGFDVPFGFAGGLHDRDTGLVRFGYRDYDPEIGRWTAKDPIGFDGGDSDLYGYVLNDPVNLIDPWGLIKSEQIGNIIFNETRSLNGENIDQARINIAHAILNADAKWGEKRSKYAGTAPDRISCVPKNEQDTYINSQLAAVIAYHQQGADIDPTNGATNFNFRNTDSQSPFWGMSVQTHVGPLDNSYPTKALNETGIYANTYK